MYAKSFIYYTYSQEEKRLKGGNFAKKMIGDWDKKVKGEAAPKMFVYGAHDLSGKNQPDQSFLEIIN